MLYGSCRACSPSLPPNNLTSLFAQSKAAEQMLWKTVFYTVIEEFRRRIKAATAQGEKGSEPLRKVHVFADSLALWCITTAVTQA